MNMNFRLFVSRLHKHWREVSRDAQSRCKEHKMDKIAKVLADCKLFTGKEEMNELIRLIYSPQGMEFMVKHYFPSMAEWREFRNFDADRYNIFIDAGDIRLLNPHRVILVGNTTATIEYTATEAYQLCVLQGAKAEVSAKGYSVVKIEADASAIVRCDKQEFAKVLK